MKIINTGLFYPKNSDSAFHGYIKLTQSEFDYTINHILKNRQVNKYYQGAGKYPYIGKDMLREKLKEHKEGEEYCLGVYVTDYIVNLLENESRYHYKKQNYTIKII